MINKSSLWLPDSQNPRSQRLRRQG